jgi:hypothetical protein
MAKLKCKNHGRRVLVLQPTLKVIHREDGTECETALMTLDAGSILTRRDFING